ncbi:COMM domain-containing protein [Curtobacterium sp. VKM Ac-2884]|uniref:COMM domain-containing protein n=1 Tax=Curtobacterium sp. VKM Ac-2884 TaxID=2783818 RepID=UPI00188A7B4D|nr:COMM domain-containing protein [Curtobacterium sp. VKM Ac-2884]MBF4602819.1 hypothetical protein [Curtobacterium sp. VKM Ac-2884]
MAECRVQGCTNTPTDVFVVEDLKFEYLVCAFHLQALGEGEPWEEATDGRSGKILMGDDIAPDFIDGSWRTVVGSSGQRHTLHLKVGRDGVEDGEITFAVSPEQAGQLAKVLQQIAGEG